MRPGSEDGRSRLPSRCWGQANETFRAGKRMDFTSPRGAGLRGIRVFRLESVGRLCSFTQLLNNFSPVSLARKHRAVWSRSGTMHLRPSTPNIHALAHQLDHARVRVRESPHKH